VDPVGLQRPDGVPGVTTAGSGQEAAGSERKPDFC
jgi:hypothetical protein